MREPGWWRSRFQRCAEDPIASQFLTDLETKGYSASTVEAYGRALNLLLDFNRPLTPACMTQRLSTSAARRSRARFAELRVAYARGSFGYDARRSQEE